MVIQSVLELGENISKYCFFFFNYNAIKIEGVTENERNMEENKLYLHV